MTKFLRSINLGTRIALLVVVLLMVGIWGLAARVTAVLQNDMEELISDELSVTVKYVGNDMNTDIVFRLEALQRIAAAITPDMLADRARLQEQLAQQEVVRALFDMNLVVVDKQGIIVAEPLDPERVGRSVKERPYFPGAMASGKPVIVSPVTGRVNHINYIPVTVPLRDAAGAIIGMLVDRVPLSESHAFGQLEGVKIGKNGYFLVVSPRDRLIVSATDRSSAMKALPAQGEDPLLDRRLHDGFEGPGITTDALGVEVLTAGRTMPTTGWMLVASVPTKEIFAPIATLKRQVYLSAFLMWLAVMAILQFILSREFARLKVAGDAMRRMTEGKEALAAIPVGQQDEIGNLIGNFNRLATERSRLDTELRGEITERKQAQQALNLAMSRLQALSDRHTKSLEEERRSIAFELHQQTMQELDSLKIQLQRLQPFSSSSAAQVRLRDALVTTRLMQQRVQNLVLGLRPPLLDDFGLLAALDAHCKRQAEAEGWTLHFQPPDAAERPERKVELACFRVVEEALANIARHAKASEVWVDMLPSGNALHLSVRDNGVGFNAAAMHDRVDFGTLGILEMEERIRQVGGRFEIKSSPGKGTVIFTIIPVRSRVSRELEDASVKT